MGISDNQAIVTDVTKGEHLPDYNKISAIVVTGSHAMVTDHEKWSEAAAEWLKDAVQHKIPTLGICYGHQLLAYSLGGEVGNNTHGGEFGTVEVHLNKNAESDRLFSKFPEKVNVQVCHSQSVLKLPKNTTLLGSSKMDPHQAFVYNDTAWGIQFHPEFDADITIEYIHHFKEMLHNLNKNPENLVAQTKNTEFGNRFLRRFADLIR